MSDTMVDILTEAIDPVERDTSQPPIENLADDKDLVKKVMARLDSFWNRYSTDRTELEEIWETCDYMFKCGQAATKAEEERARTDVLPSDNMTKTKAQKLGSTMFFRCVRDLAALLVSVVTSKKDPYTFKPIYNPDIFYSQAQADEMAMQHNLLMRWTRTQENFIVKFIEFAYQIVKYGNLPVCSLWKRRRAEVPIRKPLYFDAGNGGNPEILGFEHTREWKIVENYPTWLTVPNENFYTDQNISEIQKQECIIVTSLTNMAELYAEAREGEFINVETIKPSHAYTGHGGNSIFAQKEMNSGYTSNTDDTQTRQFERCDGHIMLPIDPTKAAGNRWDPEKHEGKKYWVTAIKGFGSDGVCLAIRRNRDPNDDWPFEMINAIPDDADKLYKVAPAQIVRSNYTESTISKEQAIDAKTLNNNRPLKVIRGEVFTDDPKFGKDKIIEVEKGDSMTEFLLTPIWDNNVMEDRLNRDSDEALGTGKAVRGEAMGGRTSAGEAVNAYEASQRPHAMNIKYLLNKFLRFHAMKGIALWQLHADPKQVLQITDEPQYQRIMPSELFGEFTLELTLVDDYEENQMQQQNLTWAAQNILPLFVDVMDKRKLGQLIFDKFLHLDVSEFIKPDKSADAVRVARMENRVMMEQGQYDPPEQGEDHPTHLREHKGEEIKWQGTENPYVPLIQRHIQETEFLMEQEQQAGAMASASPERPPQAQNQGQAMGNMIAAGFGAQQNG